MKFVKYIKDLLDGCRNLLLGLKITMTNLIRPKVTEQYPENRGEKVYFDRFRAELTMPHNEKNEHKCIGCGLCQMACPNGTIKVITKSEVDSVTGKPKRMLDKYVYDLGTCVFCGACVDACPHGAIKFVNQFEQAVFTREKLILQLNREGSKLEEKPVAKAVEPIKTENKAQAENVKEK